MATGQALGDRSSEGGGWCVEDAKHSDSSMDRLTRAGAGGGLYGKAAISNPWVRHSRDQTTGSLNLPSEPRTDVAGLALIWLANATPPCPLLAGGAARRRNYPSIVSMYMQCHSCCTQRAS
jgi:hypothetical protein